MHGDGGAQVINISSYLKPVNNAVPAQVSEILPLQPRKELLPLNESRPPPVELSLPDSNAPEGISQASPSSASVSSPLNNATPSISDDDPYAGAAIGSSVAIPQATSLQDPEPILDEALWRHLADRLIRRYRSLQTITISVQINGDGQVQECRVVQSQAPKEIDGHDVCAIFMGQKLFQVETPGLTPGWIVLPQLTNSSSH
jgi:hypothetical protein